MLGRIGNSTPKLGTAPLKPQLTKLDPSQAGGAAAADEFFDELPLYPHTDIHDEPSLGAAVDINFAARPNRSASGSGEV